MATFQIKDLMIKVLPRAAAACGLNSCGGTGVQQIADCGLVTRVCICTECTGGCTEADFSRICICTNCSACCTRADTDYPPNCVPPTCLCTQACTACTATECGCTACSAQCTNACTCTFCTRGCTGCTEAACTFCTGCTEACTLHIRTHCAPCTKFCSKDCTEANPQHCTFCSRPSYRPSVQGGLSALKEQLQKRLAEIEELEKAGKRGTELPALER